jgi:hypothetical protein
MRKPSGRLGKPVAAPLLCAAMLFLLFCPAHCHAQAFCTGYPTITSVTPNTWIAGKTSNITIMGSGFNTQWLFSTWVDEYGHVLPLYCTNDVVTFGVNAGSVQISNVNIVSSSEITAAVTPEANDPSETVCIDAEYSEIGPWFGAPPQPTTFIPSPTTSYLTDPGSTCIPIYNDGEDAFATAQIVGCDPPAITTVKPSTWFAGKSYKTTITGTGFTTKEKATAACPETPVTITAADGSAVPVSNVHVDSGTQITVTGIAPPAADPTESATVTAGTAPNTSTPPTQAQILGNQIQCDPSMNCTQDVISTTDGSDPPVQNVVVGQPIILTTNPNLPASITPYKTTWTVGGTNIGGYTPTLASATVAETALKSTSLNTYWAYPANTIPVTYKYCVNIPGVGNQCSEIANATFSVTGPTANIVPSTTSWNPSPPIPMCNSTAKEQMLSFGTYDPTTSTVCAPLAAIDGITFTATVNISPQNSGQTEWIQVISKDNATLTTPSGQTIPFNGGSGLDTALPYNDPPDPLDATTTVTVDSPGVELPMNDSRVARTFSAKMYLMWTSQIPSSIPVPLGYVKWAVSGTAVQNDKTHTWSVASSIPTTAQFQVSYDSNITTHGLPTWSRLVTGTLTNSTAVSANESEANENEEEQQ